MMRRLFAIVLAGLGTGCTANPPQAVPAVAVEAAPAVVEAVDPVIPPVVAPPEPVAEPGPPAEPVLDLEPLQRALGGGVSDAVVIVATHAIGREQLVLARVYDERLWFASQKAAGRIEALSEQYGEAAAKCEEENSALDVRCTLEFAKELHLAWDLLGVKVFAWEVARLRPEADGYSVVARRRLNDASMLNDDDFDEPLKFKVYDIDGDRRPEATIIVPIRIPTGDALENTIGQIGTIVDASDLHEQFITSRRFNYVFEDVSRSETDAETTWFARDVDADGHADLQLREVVRESFSGGEDEESRDSKKSTTRKTTCPYDPASDAWRCPEALGRQLFEPR
jgi:hypothetical protein